MRKVLVIGAGIAGLTLARALKEQKVHLFETSKDHHLGTGIWLTPNALSVFDKLGIADEIRSRAIALEKLELWNYKGKLIKVIPADEIAMMCNNPIVAILRSELHSILSESQPDISFEKNYVESIDYGDRVIAKFSDETYDEGDFLIGADGLFSNVRESLFPKQKVKSAGIICWRGIADVELPDNLKAKGIEIWGNGGVFGFSQIALGQTYWFAARKVRDGTLESFNDFCEPVKTLIEKTQKAMILGRELFDLKPTKSWTRGSQALLGDAAHGVLPFLGQGASLAIESSYVLAKHIQNRGTLKGYEKSLFEKAKGIRELSRKQASLAMLKHPLITAPRDFLIRCFPEKAILAFHKKLYQISS